MSGTKDQGRRFLVVGLSAVNGVETGGELWEGELPEGTNVDALIQGGHLREMEPENKPSGSSASSRRTTAAREPKDGGGDE